MAVAPGAVVYRLGSARCSGTGIEWSDDELASALQDEVATVLFDEEGKAKIETMLATTVDTEFAQQGLRRVLNSINKTEDWRVGEAIAETWLTSHRSCTFPWPHSRDQRKSGSSLPGADLVGFGVDDQGDCLAFGEVKSSSDPSRPPGIMRGRTGLKKQLEDLRDREPIRDDLLKYLAYRAKSTPWRHKLKKAASRYLANSSDIQLFGFLVRDIAPHENDLRARVNGLAGARPDQPCIELIALYLPSERLQGLGDQALAMCLGEVT